MAKDPTAIPEDRKQILVSIFSHAIGIADILGRYNVVDPGSFNAIRNELRFLKENLESIGIWIHELPQSVRSEVEVIGSIFNEAECNIGYNDVCISFLNYDIKTHGERGWREVLRLTKSPSIPWAKPARQAHELQQDDSEEGDIENANEPISERGQHVLVAMLILKAFDADSLKSTERIANKAIGNGVEANSLKSVMSDLKTHKFVQSKTGRGGGCWLTEKGKNRAEKLKNQG